MCGIAGFATPTPRLREARLAVAKAMGKRMHSRGPDNSGEWLSPDGEIAFAHRRLSILDLSETGRQPMHSRCGRFSLVYNGEIYNHQDIRCILEKAGHTFLGTSDTETLLAALCEWGIRDTLPRLRGMFAIAIWDRDARTITLVRDRLGIKPLYYSAGEKGLLFASVPSALTEHPNFRPDISTEALGQYLRYGSIPAPLSIYEDIRKLPPASILTYERDTSRTTIDTYWDIHKIWQRGAEAPFSGSAKDATDTLESLIADAIRCRLISDVPLGAFLSGGIDSSTVAALMTRLTSDAVRTFSIGFSETDFDESPYAKQVADILGTRHTAFTVTPRDLLSTIPDLPQHFDEPFGDASQMPTLLLSRLARQHVTVCLSGDGGDELFSGYARYALSLKAWNMIRYVPPFLRHTIRRGAGLLPRSLARRMNKKVQGILWRMDALTARDLAALYDRFMAHHPAPSRLVHEYVPQDSPRFVDRDPWRAMSLHDLTTYLPDDILTKVDRASMAASLEARLPLLDHRIVEFAATLPPHLLREHGGKGILKNVLYRHLPPEIFSRPKAGFTVPIERWMRLELREWCEDMLSPATLNTYGLLDADEVQRMWRDYLAGFTPWHSSLWDILMLSAWLTSSKTPVMPVSYD